MSKQFWVTGDTHREFERFQYMPDDPNIAIIILGDVGLNYCLDQRDYDEKKALCDRYPFTFYCVKGNHEARPSDVTGMIMIQDDDVGGTVWYEPEFPRIRYFCEWGHYNINGLRTLVIGGAYSVDKYYRIERGLKWFKNEQLTDFEMNSCFRNAEMQEFDLVLTHTCPYSWRPTDLFLSCVDQSTVDNTMELWMDKLKGEMNWGIWLYGHYHADRLERPHVELFYENVRPLSSIKERWDKYDRGEGVAYWLEKSPNFYWDDTERFEG